MKLSSSRSSDHDIVLQKMKQSISQMQAQVNQTLYKRDEMAQACEHIDHVCVADCKIAHSNMNKTIKDLKDNADPGYNISYDNIDIRRERRNRSIANQNLNIHWVNHRCTFNRVSGNHLSTDPGPVVLKVPNISLLPSLYDQEIQRHNLIVLVSRILVQHFSALSFLESVCIRHISHKYVKEMSMKSEQILFY